MITNLVEALQAAVMSADEAGYFPDESGTLLRKAVGAVPKDEAIPSHPAELFGPWSELPPRLQAAIRRSIETEARRVMSAHPRGRLWPGMVSAFHSLQAKAEATGFPAKLLKLGGRLEGHAWSGAMRVQQTMDARRHQRGWQGKGPLGLDEFLHGLGQTPHWLLGDFATDVAVDPRCRGFHYDRGRNVTFGYLLGLDLLPSEDGYWCVEANLSTAFNEKRKAALGPEPAVRTTVDLAEELGARRIQWYDPEWVETAGWLIEELHDAAEAADMTVSLHQGYRFPKTSPGAPGLPRPSRFVVIPENVPSNTLVVRRNAYPVGTDYLVSDKGPFTRSVSAALNRSGDRRVRVPVMSSDAASSFSPPTAGLPNLVYKYPAESKGLGVYFLKVDNPRDAEVIARKLDRDTGRRPGLFQPFVCSKVLDGNRIYDIRCEVLITPHGAHHVFSIRREAMRSLPETLENGLVREQGVFTSNLATGGRFWPVDPAEAEGTRQAALAIGEALVTALNYTFRTIE